MFPEEFHDLARPQVLKIIETIKTCQGITVADLARELELSYMGAKQQCLKLEEMGYLKKWRVPREKVGRPEVLYVLSSKCDNLFPQAGVGLSLNVMEGVRKLYGESAPEKILFHHFEQQRELWMTNIRKGKSLVEKATRLAALRDQSGCFGRCHYSPKDGFRIEEYHHPLKAIFEAYPAAIKMEVRMMELLLGCKIQRKVIEREKGGNCTVYEVGTLGRG